MACRNKHTSLQYCTINYKHKKF